MDLPPPLVTDHDHVRVARRVRQGNAHYLEHITEYDREGEHGKNGPKDLQIGVPESLRGLLIFPPIAVTDDGINQHRSNDCEDDSGNHEDEDE